MRKQDDDSRFVQKDFLRVSHLKNIERPETSGNAGKVVSVVSGRLLFIVINCGNNFAPRSGRVGGLSAQGKSGLKGRRPLDEGGNGRFKRPAVAPLPEVQLFQGVQGAVQQKGQSDDLLRCHAGGTIALFELLFQFVERFVQPVVEQWVQQLHIGIERFRHFGNEPHWVRKQAVSGGKAFQKLRDGVILHLLAQGIDIFVVVVED